MRSASTEHHVWVTFASEGQASNARFVDIRRHATRQEAISFAQEHCYRYGVSRILSGGEIVDFGAPDMVAPQIASPVIGARERLD